jgi:hypothetical protein
VASEYGAGEVVSSVSGPGNWDNIQSRIREIVLARLVN